MKKLRLPAFLVLLAILLLSCNQDGRHEKRSDPNQFEDYISGYTSGTIASQTPVTVTLSKEVQGISPGDETSLEIFDFDPEIEGKTFLIDPFTIEFRPDAPFVSGAYYSVDFALGNLFEARQDLKVFNFGFSIIAKDFTVYRGSLMSANPDDDDLKKYEGKVVTSDVMPVEEISKILEASSPFGSLTVKVSANGARDFAYVIDNIPRKEQPYDATLTWNGNAIGTDKEGSFKINIPSLSSFSLLNVEVDNDSENQSIKLQFSDPVDPNQSLTGLVRIKDLDGFRISKSDNTITLFPETRLSGEQVVVVEASLQNRSGRVLGAQEQITVAMEALTPQVKILGSGVIMPDSRNLVLSFKTVSLRAVDVVVYKIYSNNIRQFFQNNYYNGDNTITLFPETGLSGEQVVVVESSL
nr:hypothetical protein [Bacteroidota bacterium]